jgi:2'-5' RNA ligase
MIKNYQTLARRKGFGVYAALNLSNSSKASLGKLIMTLPIPGSLTDTLGYHTTLCYSRADVPLVDKMAFPNIVIARTGKLDTFNTKSDGLCLVLHVESEAIRRLHQELTFLGAKSDYPEYKPHVTLATNCSLGVLENLPEINMLLSYDSHVIEELDLNYD